MKQTKHLICLMLCLLMLIAVVPVMEVSATTKTVDEAMNWVRSQVGQKIDTDGTPSLQPYQCVDLIKAYYSFLGASPSSGDGADYAWNTLPSGWQRIPGAQPQKGDILVYSGNSNNPNGHVAIYESDRSHYHQNFGNNPYVERITYRYNGLDNPYWGVIRPDFNGNYTLDLNGLLDGVIEDSITSYGTADIYINGTLVANDCSDFNRSYPQESSYEIKDIRALTGHTYQGVSHLIENCELKGTLNKNTSVRLMFDTNKSTLKVDPNHGFWNGIQPYIFEITPPQIYTKNYNTTLSIPVPTRDGFTFTGWTRIGSNGKLSSTTTAATYTFGAVDGAIDIITATWRCNHANSKVVSATTSTCTVKGYTAGTYCNDCQTYIYGHTEKPLAAHAIKLINQKDATYDAEGYTGDEYCTACKQTIKTGTVIPKLEKTNEPTPSATTPGDCPWCGGSHSGFFGSIVGFFHRIFAALFGARH